MRPWQIWTAALVCLTLVVTAFGWLSFKAIAADRAEHTAQEQAQLEEKVRLALWRMDTQLAKLLADESMRPTYNYTAALSLAPSNLAPATKNKVAPRDLLLVSPLLNSSIAEVRFHFQIDATGEITSPSVPTSLQCEYLCPSHVSAEQVQTSENQLASLKKLLQKQNLNEQVAKLMETNAGWLAWEVGNGEALQLSNGQAVAFNDFPNHFGNNLLIVPDEPKNSLPPITPPSTSDPLGTSPSENTPNNAPLLANGGSLSVTGAGALPLPQSDNNLGPQSGAAQQSTAQNSVKYLNQNEGYSRGGNRMNFNTDNSQAANQQGKPAAQRATQQNDYLPQQAAQLDQQFEEPQQQQLQRSVSEFQQRAAYVDNSSQYNGRNWNDDTNRQAINNYWALNLNTNNKGKASVPQPTIRTSRMVPLWVDQELFLVRRVQVGGDQVIQGCWLDWNVMRGELLKVISDLLPAADLQAVASDSAEGPRILASLPVRLNPGLLAAAVPAEAISPLGWSLLLAWSALAIAVVAIGLVGHGTIALSERRAVFVSAVTHELRTPLTTFRMYSEMLAEDMIGDEATRRSYCRTLHHEADRLSHLVENVLAYAKLERGGPGERCVTLSLGELLRIVTERVTNRAAQANFELESALDENLREKMIHTDPGAVEQIVFNLVDNSCKYAVSATDRRLHLEMSIGKDEQLEITVRDHGPGIPAAERGQLFQPFRKSAARAAVSAPGVGLGLALCRRLAWAMHGDLRLASSQSGTCFELRLPL